MKRHLAKQAEEVNARQMVIRDADAATIARYCQPRGNTPAARPPPFAVSHTDPMQQTAMQISQMRLSATPKQQPHAYAAPAVDRPETPNLFAEATKRKAKISVNDVFPNDAPEAEPMPWPAGGAAQPPPSAGRATLPPSTAFEPLVAGAPKAGRRLLGNPFPGDSRGQQSGSNLWRAPEDATAVAPPSRGGLGLTAASPTPLGSHPGSQYAQYAQPTMVMQPQQPPTPFGMPQPQPTPFGMQPASKLGAQPYSFNAMFAANNAKPAAGAQAMGRSSSKFILG